MFIVSFPEKTDMKSTTDLNAKNTDVHIVKRQGILVFC